MKIGNARYGGEFKKKQWFKLKDGESVFRILPPLGDLADKGIWSVFYSVHYGYKNSQGKMRVFQSPLVKNRKTKMIEVPDAALDRIIQGKAALEKAKAEGNVEAIEKLGKLFGNGPKIMAQYSLDNNHYVNAIDAQGNIGVLKLRHRAKLALDATIKRLRDAGIDPLSPDNGRYFVFRRTGMGLDTSFQVDVLKEKVEVQGMGTLERDVVHRLTDELIGRLSTEAAELDKLFKRPTAEEVERIVKEGAKAVDEILDASDSSGGGSEEEYDDSGEYEDMSSSSTASAAAASAPATAPQASTQAAQPAAAAPESATTRAQAPAPAAPKVESLSTPTKTTAQAISEQSDEDFLKSLGL